MKTFYENYGFPPFFSNKNPLYLLGKIAQENPSPPIFSSKTKVLCFNLTKLLDQGLLVFVRWRFMSDPPLASNVYLHKITGFWKKWKNLYVFISKKKLKIQEHELELKNKCRRLSWFEFQKLLVDWWDANHLCLGLVEQARCAPPASVIHRIKRWWSAVKISIVVQNWKGRLILFKRSSPERRDFFWRKSR